jgi:biotin carboxyl carrier protein
VEYDVEIDGQVHTVVVQRRSSDGAFVVRVGGQERVVDVSRINGRLMSLLMRREGADLVESREVSIAPNAAAGHFVVGVGPSPVPVALHPRRGWKRRDDAAPGGGGPQRIVAPMPGRIVRIAAAAGERVAPRQPIVVMEAMKMENELRTVHAGTVTEVLVREGQAVDAGTLLAVVSPAAS